MIFIVYKTLVIADFSTVTSALVLSLNILLNDNTKGGKKYEKQRNKAKQRYYINCFSNNYYSNSDPSAE